MRLLFTDWPSARGGEWERSRGGGAALNALLASGVALWRAGPGAGCCVCLAAPPPPCSRSTLASSTATLALRVALSSASAATVSCTWRICSASSRMSWAAAVAPLPPPPLPVLGGIALALVRLAETIFAVVGLPTHSLPHASPDM